MSLFLSFATEQTNLADAVFGLALCKRDNPKVVCLNATDGSDSLEMPDMKVGSVSGCKNTLDYCTGNRWKKFLIEKIDSEIY